MLEQHVCTNLMQSLLAMASRTNVSCTKRNGAWKHLSESSRRNDHEHLCFVNFGSCKNSFKFFVLLQSFALYELSACWAHCSDHVANVWSEINTVKNKVVSFNVLIGRMWTFRTLHGDLQVWRDCECPTHTTACWPSSIPSRWPSVLRQSRTRYWARSDLCLCVGESFCLTTWRTRPSGVTMVTTTLDHQLLQLRTLVFTRRLLTQCRHAVARLVTMAKNCWYGYDSFVRSRCSKLIYDVRDNKISADFTSVKNVSKVTYFVSSGT